MTNLCLRVDGSLGEIDCLSETLLAIFDHANNRNLRKIEIRQLMPSAEHVKFGQIRQTLGLAEIVPNLEEVVLTIDDFDLPEDQWVEIVFWKLQSQF